MTSTDQDNGRSRRKERALELLLTLGEAAALAFGMSAAAAAQRMESTSRSSRPAGPAGSNPVSRVEEPMSKTTAIPVVRRPDEAERVPNPIAEEIVIKLTQGETGGAVSLFESHPGPGAGPPMHVHEREDEILYVVEGTIRFVIGDQMRETPAGGVAFIPRGVPHAWQNVASKPGRVMFFFTPASPGMESFFRAFAEVPKDGPVQDEMARLAVGAGADVLGPPLARSHPDDGSSEAVA